MAPMVLIVENDRELIQYLKTLLLEHGYTVHAVSNGIAAIEYIKRAIPHIVLLDTELPQVTGETICKEIRDYDKELPIILLTDKNTTADVVRGLDLGADDYIIKPFASDELLARIKARLRKQQSEAIIFRVANLELNSQTLEVKRDGKSIQLTPQEFKLLHYLMANKGRIITREMILSRIWLYSADVETRVVDVYIGYLRKKVDVGFSQKLIHSVRGFGYIIKE